MLFSSMNLKTSNADGREKIIRFSAVTVICALGLLLQVIILLYITFASSIDTVAAIVVFMIAELLPTLTLLLTMKPPALDGLPTYTESLFWCFQDEQKLTSRTASTTSHRSTPKNSAFKNSSSGDNNGDADL